MSDDSYRLENTSNTDNIISLSQNFVNEILTTTEVDLINHDKSLETVPIKSSESQNSNHYFKSPSSGIVDNSCN